ncbi:hypothetical protein N9089_03730 [Crocinitomicaceae bacterium]|nr:hypothetical protein [Crocinitomicaceae bacterium]
MKKTITIILLMTAAKIGFCCSCIQMEDFSIKTEFNDRDVIFNGVLIQVDTINPGTDSILNFSTDEIWYTFQVIEYFKGKSTKKTIRIRSGITNADDCKFVFTKGESYVVYTNHPLTKKFKKDKSILETTVCTHTGEATEQKIIEAKNQSKYR